MINPDVLDSRANTDGTVSQADLDDLKLILYLVCVVFAGAIIILIGCVIALFAWINKLSLVLKKNQDYSLKPMPIARTLNPSEELAKRYTMSGEDNHNFKKSPTLERNPLSRSTSLKRFDMSFPHQRSKNDSLHSSSGLMKQPPQKRDKNANSSMDGMHFVEDRLRDDLFY